MTPYGIGDFVASFKGDTPGHPFRGNQFEGGSDANESSGDGENSSNEYTWNKQGKAAPGLVKDSYTGKYKVSFNKGYPNSDRNKHANEQIDSINGRLGLTRAEYVKNQGIQWANRNAQKLKTQAIKDLLAQRHAWEEEASDTK